MNKEPNLISVNRQSCDRYSLSFERFGGWAIIMMDETGCISIQSDWDNYAYRWNSSGFCPRTFKEFLIGCNWHYLIKKFSTRTCFNFDQSIKDFKSTIIEERRRKNVTREQAQLAWEDLYRLDERDDPNEFLRQATELDSLCDGLFYEYSNIPCHMDYPAYTVYFFEKIFPIFQDILRKELADASPDFGSSEVLFATENTEADMKDIADLPQSKKDLFEGVKKIF